MSPTATSACWHIRWAKNFRINGGSDFTSYMTNLFGSANEIARDGLQYRERRETCGLRAQDARAHRAGGEAMRACEIPLCIRKPALGSDHQHDGLAGIPAHGRGQ